MADSKEKLYEELPDSPGVYIFKGGNRNILYVGKAGNLKRRVSSYFMKAPASLSRRRGEHDSRIEKLLSRIKKIDCRKTETALEALILEAQLIKKYSPPFNVREKDDKSFLYIEITKERFPRVLLVRGRERLALSRAERFGPFTSASNIREALRILRRIFLWSTHAERDTNIRMRANDTNNTNKKPCFDYELGLCPGTCVGAISREDYMKNINNLKLLFAGKKKRILDNLRKEMAAASKNLEFEKAGKFRRQIFALQHIRDTALISESDRPVAGSQLPAARIEGYDISNIYGTSAVGSMVVFEGNEPDRNEYRKFKIKTITQADDVGMFREVLRRRFHNDWPLPALILVDGGMGQVNVAKNVLAEFGLKIPVVGIAKGPERKKNDFIGKIPDGIEKSTLIKMRNEAHRFALGYHKKLRSAKFLI